MITLSYAWSLKLLKIFSWKLRSSLSKERLRSILINWKKISESIKKN